MTSRQIDKVDPFLSCDGAGGLAVRIRVSADRQALIMSGSRMCQLDAVLPTDEY